ncbi:MAG: hypothetical protein ACOC1K_02110 [Nanoarchaeota archaeon]
MPFRTYLIEQIENKQLPKREKQTHIETIKGLNESDLSYILYETTELKEVYKEYPVDIETFIDDDHYLGSIYRNNLFPTWRKLLIEVYPAPLITRYDEVILSVATRGGKSTCAAISMLYEIYKLMCMKDPALYFLGKSTGRLIIALLSYSEDQVKKSLVKDISKALTSSPFFIDNRSKDLSISNMTKGGMEITDNIVISAGSDVSRITGGDLYSSALDEANICPKNISEEELVERRMDLYNEMLDRKSSTLSKAPVMSGITWMISSPTEERDVINERIYEVRANGVERVKILDNLSRWVARNDVIESTFDFFLGSDTKDPKVLEDESDFDSIGIVKDSKEYYQLKEEDKIIEVPDTSEYRNKFKTDTLFAIRNIAGRRTSSDLAFFPSVSIFNKVFYKTQDIFSKDILTINFSEENEFPFDKYLLKKDYFKNPDRKYCYRYIHLDIAWKTDFFGLASVYSDMVNFKSKEGIELRKRVFYTDFCLGVQPSKGERVDILEVLKFVYSLRKMGYPIKKVTTDSQQGELARQIITKAKVLTEYLSTDTSREPYLNLKNVIQEGLLVGYKNPPLIKDLRNLRDFGKKITKPKGKGYSDDMSNALAGALHSCLMDKDGFKTSVDTINSLMNYQHDLSSISHNVRLIETMNDPDKLMEAMNNNSSGNLVLGDDVILPNYENDGKLGRGY